MTPPSTGPTTPATLALKSAGIAFTPHSYEHDDAAHEFGAEASDKLNIDPERVFKTLVTVVDGALAVGVVPVAGRLNLKNMAAALGGKRAVMADPAEAERKTGYVVGGISPIGQKTALPTILDETAQLFETIFVSGGRRGFDLELAPTALLAITNGRYADIAQ